ncbi:MAG: cupin domain-containing protein [Candidatus Omnitrophica bacterium]|nr:cupin domain-containing protein [Candidatus Omnitrophota bacterium]
MTHLLPICYGVNSWAFFTAIYYLLTPETLSRMHRLQSDEMFHFYIGDTAERRHLFEDGHSQTIIMGNDLSRNFEMQVVVSKGV